MIGLSDDVKNLLVLIVLGVCVFVIMVFTLNSFVDENNYDKIKPNNSIIIENNITINNSEILRELKLLNDKIKGQNDYSDIDFLKIVALRFASAHTFKGHNWYDCEHFSNDFYYVALHLGFDKSEIKRVYGHIEGMGNHAWNQYCIDLEPQTGDFVDYEGESYNYEPNPMMKTYNNFTWT